MNAAEHSTLAGELVELSRRVAVLERLLASGGSVRTVRGAVYNDATVISGAGFTVTWADHLGGSPSSNIHTITFDTPFDGAPIFVPAANNNNPPATEGAYGVSVKAKDPGGAWVEVEMVNFDGTTGDGGYEFIATQA